MDDRYPVYVLKKYKIEWNATLAIAAFKHFLYSFGVPVKCTPTRLGFGMPDSLI